MIAADRREAVLRELRLRGSLAVAPFAARLGVSGVTLRRDLRELEAEGQLTRVHGGATLRQQPNSVEQPLERSTQRLAASMGVSPQGAGTPLATIGMIVPTRGYYYAETVAGATAAARLADIRLILAVSDYNEGEELRLLERMLGLGIDGVLLTSSRSDIAASPLRPLIEDAPIPVTVLERVWDLPTRGRVVDSVRSDHPHGAEVAVHHLAELGHRHVGLWTFDNPHVDQLRSGFDRAVAELGLTAYRAPFDYGHPDWSSVDSTANVRRYVDDAVAAGVTALIVHPDQLALQVVQVALDRGVQIPEQLSVVAYDDEVASLGELALTAVAPPKRAIGFAAIDTCLRAVAHGEPGAQPYPAQRLRLLPELRVRESTAPPPVA